MRRRNLVSGGRTLQAEGTAETESVGGKRLGKFRKCNGAMAGTWMVPGSHAIQPKELLLQFTLFFSSSTNFLTFLWVPLIPFHTSPSIATPHALPSRQVVGRRCTANDRCDLSLHLFTSQTLTGHRQCPEPCPGPLETCAAGILFAGGGGGAGNKPNKH